MPIYLIYPCSRFLEKEWKSINCVRIITCAARLFSRKVVAIYIHIYGIWEHGFYSGLSSTVFWQNLSPCDRWTTVFYFSFQFASLTKEKGAFPSLHFFGKILKNTSKKSSIQNTITEPFLYYVILYKLRSKCLTWFHFHCSEAGTVNSTLPASPFLGFAGVNLQDKHIWVF